VFSLWKGHKKEIAKIRKMENHLNIFTNIYENCVWGDNRDKNYKGTSGGGSEVKFNKEYIVGLKAFLTKKKIKSIADLGCGDFRCGKSIYNDLKNIKYCGYDAYDKIIKNNKKNHINPKYSFKHLDFFNKKESIKPADLCILKDVLQHWKTDCIYTFLDYLIASKKFKFILICNCCSQSDDTADIITGEWRGLSRNFLPLKKYNCQHLFNYQTKEVLLIKV
jgi:hypothetical protein